MKCGGYGLFAALFMQLRQDDELHKGAQRNKLPEKCTFIAVLVAIERIVVKECKFSRTSMPPVLDCIICNASYGC